MSKAHLAALTAFLLVLRWLAAVRLPLPVAGTVITVPALAVLAAAVIVVTAGLAALLVCRTRAEQAMIAAWHARKASAR